jgi:hypothetical protein
MRGYSIKMDCCVLSNFHLTLLKATQDASQWQFQDLIFSTVLLFGGNYVELHIGNIFGIYCVMVKISKKSAVVLDITPAIGNNWLLGMEKALDVEGLTLIDFSDVTRIQKADNESTQDEVLYGTRAEAQVLHAFKFFGFVELPRTWGELQGVYDFCVFFRSTWVGSRHTPLRDQIKRIAIESINDCFPEYSELIELYLEQDLVTLTAIVKRTNLMYTLGVDYREIEDRDPTYSQSKLL